MYGTSSKEQSHNGMGKPSSGKEYITISHGNAKRTISEVMELIEHMDVRYLDHFLFVSFFYLYFVGVEE